MGAIRVLLVGDHPVVRLGLSSMLAGETGIEVVGEAASGEDGLQKTVDLQPQVVLMGLRMPGIDGGEATRQIKKACPTTAVVMFAVQGSGLYALEALRAGAVGYLTEDCSRDLLCHAIRVTANGGALLLAEALRQAVLGLPFLPNEKGDNGDLPLLGHLTPREREVLGLLAQGSGNKAICTELHLAEVTVKKHVQSIISKLGVSGRIQAAILGVRLGLPLRLPLAAGVGSSPGGFSSPAYGTSTGEVR